MILYGNIDIPCKHNVEYCGNAVILKWRNNSHVCESCN